MVKYRLIDTLTDTTVIETYDLMVILTYMYGQAGRYIIEKI